MDMVAKMNSKIVAVFLALLLAPLALAFTITEVTTSGPTTQVTTGTSVTISSVISSDESGNANQISLTSNPSSLSVTDPSSGSFSTTSIAATGTTLNFVVSPAAVGTYEYFVTAQYSGGATSSTTSTLQVVAPSSLSVSGSANSTSHVVGTVFSVTVTVSNPSATSNVTTSYALSFANPSAFTLVSGDSSAGTLTLEPLGSVIFTYNIRAEAAASSSNILFGLGSTSNVFTQAITNTAVATPVPPSSSGGSSTPTPTATAAPTATSQPAFIPAPKTTTGTDEPVVSSESKQIGTSSAVTASFGETSATFEIAYTAPAGGFSGELTHTLPFDYADYQSGLITFDPQPSRVAPGSIVATWDVALAPGETFLAKMDVAKAVDQTVINEFKAPKLAPRSSSAPSAATPIPAATTSAEPAASAAPAGANNTLLYVVGALVVLGLLYYFVAMRKK